jgi:hypothetical protein
MRFKVIGDSIDSYESKGRQYSNRRVILLGSGPDLGEQLVELNLPPEHPAIGVGVEIEVHVREITAIFNGKPRIRGEITFSPELG